MVRPVDSSAEPDLTVCVFAWNEVDTFASFMRELVGTLEPMPAAWEILVIDDGSTDGTSEAADAAASADPRVRVIHHGQNGGLGAVYRTGFENARGRYITFFPADAQFPAEIVTQFYPRMKDHDMVLGYIPNRKGSVLGPILSRVERVLYRVLFGPMPRFQGILMFRRSLLDGMTLKSQGRGWAVLMEFIMRASRAKVRMVSVPTTMRARTAGASKVNNIRTIKANMQQLMKLRLLID
jgi:glycosyltransferase involved in cell wall biosynthesis